MNIKSLIVLVFAYLGFSNMWLRSKVNRLDEELSDARSNIEYYQQSLNGTQDQNRVLQLTINDFKHSKDSLITELSNVQDQLKIKDKKLKEAMKVSTVLRDTIVDIVPIGFCCIAYTTYLKWQCNLVAVGVCGITTV